MDIVNNLLYEELSQSSRSSMQGSKLNSGACLSQINREYNGLTPLICAALRDRLRCVITLIELGADVNCGVSDDINKTPLTSAIDR